VSVAGRLHYLEALPQPGVKGRGTLLLLHAFPLNARMWESQLPAFAGRGWRVIAPHLRGFAKRGRESFSEAAAHLAPGGPKNTPDPFYIAKPVVAEKNPPDPFFQRGVGTDPVPTGAAPSVDDYAGDVIDLLDALHVHEAVVVGLSMGGYVAFAMMRLASRYIHALVLADTRPQADTPEGLENRKRMVQLARERGVAAIADEMVPKLLGETTRRQRPDVVSRVRSLALSSSLDGVVGALEAMKTRPDSTPLLASIHVPTLVLVGDEDGITPPAVAEAMHRAIAGSQLVVVPGAGHLPNLEDPNAFDASLADFLEHRV
jgi:3-oxoadipate enol-lactonase